MPKSIATTLPTEFAFVCRVRETWERQWELRSCGCLVALGLGVALGGIALKSMRSGAPAGGVVVCLTLWTIGMVFAFAVDRGMCWRVHVSSHGVTASFQDRSLEILCEEIAAIRVHRGWIQVRSSDGREIAFRPSLGLREDVFELLEESVQESRGALDL